VHLNCTVHWAPSTPNALSTQCTTNLEHSHALSTQCRLTWQALALSATDLLGTKVPVRALCVVLLARVGHKKGWQRPGTVSWVLRDYSGADYSGANHPLSPVIELSIYHPREKKTTLMRSQLGKRWSQAGDVLGSQTAHCAGLLRR